MQERTERRPNKVRSESTRSALIAAARELFVEKSYGEVGTPEIVAAAGLTRGALYHHFAGKQDLFRAVVEEEARAAAAEIERASPPGGAPIKALIAGGRAFIGAMQTPGRTRLMLLDGPAVLGRIEMDEIDARHAARTLREGLDAAMTAGAIRPLPLEPLTAQLAAVFDRAALAIETGASAEDAFLVIEALIEGLEP